MVSEFYAAGIAGMIGGLLWQAVLPYFLARRKAEVEGNPIPSFSKEYATTALIGAISGLIAVFMAAETFEKAIVNATSIMMAAGIGFSFTYTVLGISNTIVDLKTINASLKKEVKNLEESNIKLRKT